MVPVPREMRTLLRMLRRFLAMDQRERQLVLRAWWVVAVTRVRLSLTSYGALESRVMERPLGTRGVTTAAELALAVRRASRLVPVATCLVQCLATAWLLRGAGYEPRLHLGVKTGPEGFGAHAWLACDDEIVIGAEAMGDYQRFERR